jgi:uncharacterized membrane protein HdeD (DUF308 family)
MAQNIEGAARGLAETVFGEVGKNWGWMLALGIIMIVLGTIGLGMTFGLTLVGVLFFGWLLVIGGVFQVLDAFKCKGWKSVLWHVLISLVYIAAGATAIYDPVGASLALTALIAGALIAVGVLRVIMAFQVSGGPRWWLLLGGLLALVLGGMIFAEWPVSGLWVIGLFIAIELIMNGWTYVMLSLAARQATKGGQPLGAATT